MATREGRTHYDVLGVARDASAAEIRRAFQRLTLAHHPDRNKDNPSAGKRMAEINAAYGVLRDRRKRQEYDAALPLETTSPDDGRGSNDFSNARTHWERADTEQQEWQAYVAQVQAELKGWTDDHLRAFMSEHAALAEETASLEERSMHQWFAAVTLEEIEFREEQVERERAEQERRQRERERRRREERERAEQARREQLQREERERAEKARRERLRREERERREAQQNATPPSVPDESVTSPHPEERQREGRTWRILRRLAARVGAALIVLLVHLIAVALIAGTDPDNPEVASDGAAIGAVIWLLCAVFALALAGVDAFEKVSDVWRKRSLGVLAALIVLSIVISAVV